MMTERFKVIDFPHFTDERGGLVPFELDHTFPFAVKRVYLVTANNGQTRGGHAHKMESEVFVAAQGSITALVNDGSGDQTIALNTPNKALLVNTNCWHEFYNFSGDAVLLCFSSTHYTPGEKNYVMDKDQFLSETKTQ